MDQLVLWGAVTEVVGGFLSNLVCIVEMYQVGNIEKRKFDTLQSNGQ